MTISSLIVLGAKWFVVVALYLAFIWVMLNSSNDAR